MKFNKRNVINLTWTDYQKAYDSIPYSWIKEILNIFKINQITTNFIIHSIQDWKTKIKLIHSKGTIFTPYIAI